MGFSDLINSCGTNLRTKRLMGHSSDALVWDGRKVLVEHDSKFLVQICQQCTHTWDVRDILRHVVIFAPPVFI